MRKAHAWQCAAAWCALALLGLALSVGCSKDVVSPDPLPPTGSTIQNPSDGASLNSETISVRGRAEVGATVDLFVNDVHAGSGVASPAVPDDGRGGRFTIEDVGLGDEGEKIIRARVTDLYGNVAIGDETPEVTVTLDLTAPPVALETVLGAEWVDTPGFWGDGFWETGATDIVLRGRTDPTASYARVRLGVTEFEAESYETAPGDPDSVRFWIPMSGPPLWEGHADTVMTYFLEAVDEAGNIASQPVTVHWDIEGREAWLLQDDGEYDQWEHKITGRPGQRIAVRFQAPTWANYVTKILYYIANDEEDNPFDPTLPSTLPFTAWVWQVSAVDGMPGSPGNDGHVPFGEPYMYPEDQWVPVRLPNAVRITDNSLYPDLKFFVGLEWQYRDNPYIYEDQESATNPLDYASFFWDWGTWSLLERDTMIRAVVSDVENMGEGREAVIMPTRAGAR